MMKISVINWIESLESDEVLWLQIFALYWNLDTWS